MTQHYDHPDIPDVAVVSETEAYRGWVFELRVHHHNAEPTSHRLKLSWADYEHWCGGSLPPERVARGVARFLLHKEGPDAIPAEFDAASIRRRYPDIDSRLSELL